MAVLVTQTKVIIPQIRRDFLSRPRLINQLYDLLDYKLILVIAPPGYGKTSLLIDFAHQVELPVCWLSLDELDLDPQRFLTHFIASINRRFPTFGNSSIAALEAYNQPGKNLNQLIATIVNDAYEHIQEHFLVILDDYHIVSSQEEIEKFTNRFVSEAAGNLHLALSSRTLLSLPDMPLFVARTMVGGLSFDELAFRTDEIQTLILKNYHTTIPEATANELAQETEGWITGLLLSAQAAVFGMKESLKAARLSGIGLYDYLAQQVLDKQERPIQEFLLYTSFLDEIDVDLCTQIWGTEKDWRSLIKTVVHNNLFVLPVGEDGRWLRYHHLFRDFLQTRFQNNYPTEMDNLLKKIAQVYITRQEWERAYAIYRRLGDTNAIVNLIEQSGSWMIKNVHMATLSGWLESLPEPIIDNNPNLLSLMGTVLLFKGEVEKSLSFFNKSEEALRASKNHSGLARTLARRATTYRLSGHYREALIDGNQALELTNTFDGFDTIKAEALRVIGMSLYYLGQLSDSAEKLNQSLNEYTLLSDNPNIALVHMELGMCLQATGSFQLAQEHYDAALQYWRAVNNTSRQAYLLNNLGTLQLLLGNYQQAGITFEEALKHAEMNDLSRIKSYILCSIGDLYMELEADVAAKDVYNQAQEIAQQINERFLIFYINLANANQSRRARDYENAHIYMHMAERLIHEGGSDFERGLFKLTEGQIYLNQGHLQEAINCIQEAIQIFNQGGQKLDIIRAYLNLAQSQYAYGNRSEAWVSLEKTYQIASELDSQQFLVTNGRDAKNLIEIAKDDPQLGNISSMILDKIAKLEKELPSLRRQLRPHTPSVLFTPPKLKIRALGKTEVFLEGVPLRNEDFIYQRQPRELFYYLLAHPDGLTKGEIGSALWQASTPHQLKLQFRNALYKLRYVLGQDIITFDGSRYLFNRSLDYEYDVEEFDTKIKQGQLKIIRHEKQTLFQEAIKIYQGVYFPEGQGAWVVLIRQNLFRLYSDAILTLAQYSLEDKEYNTTLIYCRRLLDEDRSNEEGHRIAMKAYAALNDMRGVIQQYQECCKALLDEFNSKPSSQTITLYNLLRH